MSREGLFVRVDLRLWYLTTIFPPPTLPNFPDRLPHLKTNVDKYKWFGVVQFKITLLDSIARHYYYFDRAWWRHQMETFSHFPRYWPFVRGIHRSPVNSPHKGQWRGALMFTLICTRINGWVNNREAGDLRRHRAHNNVIVMEMRYYGRRTLSMTYTMFLQCGVVITR